MTLVVPNFNDDPQGLRWIARHLASIDVDMPWHLNAFYPRYRWRDRPSQGAGLLVTVAGTAYALGLRHVYVGNLADHVRELSHTRCPRCQTVVVERRDYRTLSVNFVGGHCPTCGTAIAGRWVQRTRCLPITDRLGPQVDGVRLSFDGTLIAQIEKER